MPKPKSACALLSDHFFPPSNDKVESKLRSFVHFNDIYILLQTKSMQKCGEAKSHCECTCIHTILSILQIKSYRELYVYVGLVYSYDHDRKRCKDICKERSGGKMECADVWNDK